MPKVADETAYYLNRTTPVVALIANPAQRSAVSPIGHVCRHHNPAIHRRANAPTGLAGWLPTL